MRGTSGPSGVTLNRSIALVPLILLGVAEWEIVQQTRAHLLERGGAWEEALALEPDNGARFARYATVLEQSGASPVAALTKAVILSPRDAALRSRLGLAEEAEADFETAERDLLGATKLSRKFEPRWSLANYYLRRERWVNFWQWILEALRVSYGDRTALFELCRQAEPDGTAQLRRVLPGDRGTRVSFAHYLFARGEAELAADLISELAETADLSEAEQFRGWCARLLESRRIREAAEVWETLRARRVVNEEAFPWQAGGTADGSAVCRRVDRDWRIILNGRQPERVDLLWRVVPVKAGRTYEMSWRMESRLATAAGEAAGGLEWRVESWGSEPVAIGTSAELAGRIGFVVPPGVEAARVALAYRRPSGEVRAEGSAVVRAATLTYASGLSVAPDQR